MSAVISDHEAAGAVADPRTSGYMLAVKVSSHPALGNSGTNVYHVAISIGVDVADIPVYITYLLAGADITSNVGQYLTPMNDPDCSMEWPVMPTSIETVNNNACFDFSKQANYTGNHTFKITVSTDSIGSQTYGPF